MYQPEVYVSIDIEADGHIPGDNSMLSFGAAAFVLDSLRSGGFREIGTFEANLELLEGAQPNPDTMKWWATQPEAWAECRKGTRHPREVMTEFQTWLKALPGNPVLAGYPVTYDFMWVHWYFVHFCGFPTPYGFQGLDIKTLVMDRMHCTFRNSTKRNMPKAWFAGTPKHTHKALDDARGQGVLLMNILVGDYKQND